jgi:hypothetical protein
MSIREVVGTSMNMRPGLDIRVVVHQSRAVRALWGGESRVLLVIELETLQTARSPAGDNN